MRGCIEVGCNKTFSTVYYIDKHWYKVDKSNFCEGHRPKDIRYFKTKKAAELWLIKEML